MDLFETGIVQNFSLVFLHHINFSSTGSILCLLKAEKSDKNSEESVP